MRERKVLSDFIFFPELVLTSSNFSALFQFDSETFWLFAPVYYTVVQYSQYTRRKWHTTN